MQVLFVTNFPSPYRIDFFNRFGEFCDLTVAFERRKALHRDEQWKGSEERKFTEVYLESRPFGTSQSIGFELTKYVAASAFDVIIFSGYASPSVIFAMEYCNLTGRSYYIEYDGGFDVKDSFFKRMIKKHLVRKAKGHFITCKETEKYLITLGVKENTVFYYPFSSLHEKDILKKPLTLEEKKQAKELLGIAEQCAILSVGRFVRGKGFDELLNALNFVDRNIGVYIIGGKPTDEYLAICDEHNLDNVHFVSFVSKEKLFDWYKACDLFVFPTRKDIWGLVINEAMACGLPVVSSDMCIAALELVKVGINGFIYESGDINGLSECINRILQDDLSLYSESCLDVIKQYTIENMVEAHLGVLESN